MCGEIVRDRHGVVALGGRARRYKIRQVLDCGVIGADLLGVSLVNSRPAIRIMAKPGPEAAARGMSFSHVGAGMLFVSPRGQMRSTSTLVPSEALGASQKSLTPGRGTVETLDSPALPLSKGRHLALG